MWHSIGNAQSRFQFGAIPFVNINKQINGDFRLNFKTESRHITFRNNELTVQNELVDFSTLLSTKLDVNKTLAGGFLLRVRDNEIFGRFIQQYTLVQNTDALIWAHRIATDQTFGGGIDVFRLRYRLSCQIPLNGQDVNDGEFYLKVGNEYLNAFQKNDHDLELRLAIMLGYEITDNNKLEFGIDSRFDSFIDDKLRNRSWFNLGWYFAL